MSKNSFNEMDDKIIDTDEISDFDVKINPSYYIHLALINLNKSFDEKLEDSFVRYRHVVEHLEILCRSAGFVPESYDADIDNYKKSAEYSEESDKGVKIAMLSRKKLSLMMQNVFKQRGISTSLKA